MIGGLSERLLTRVPTDRVFVGFVSWYTSGGMRLDNSENDTSLSARGCGVHHQLALSSIAMNEWISRVCRMAQLGLVADRWQSQEFTLLRSDQRG